MSLGRQEHVPEAEGADEASPGDGKGAVAVGVRGALQVRRARPQDLSEAARSEPVSSFLIRGLYIQGPC